MKKIKINHLKLLFVLLLLLGNTACEKVIETPHPTSSITAPETFSTDVTANSAVAGIYSDLVAEQGGNCDYANGMTTFMAGIYADELIAFQGSSDVAAFQSNLISAINGRIYGSFWAPGYFDIYMANGVIDGLNASKTVSAAMKTQLIGEAKFLRAFVYFYLVNYFGGVPLVTTTSYATNAVLPSVAPAAVYQQIIADLTDAQTTLTSDYSYSKGERIRANKWAATALLARVYLYYASVSGDASYYGKAAAQASAVIANSGTYSLVSDLNGVFLVNSNEAIWQLEPNSSTNFATLEGYYLNQDPANPSNPNYYLTTQLLNSFERNDHRKSAWIDSVNYLGTTYYYPFKYKVQTSTALSGTSEYYMMLRLGEQYLIRAEAEAQTNDIADALTDLNKIRTRAGLPNLSTTLNQSQVLAAVAQERKIELFAEWGHRWFDLKRTGQAITVLSNDKGVQLSNNGLVWPIPLQEVQADPFLKQNPGY